MVITATMRVDASRPQPVVMAMSLDTKFVMMETKPVPIASSAIMKSLTEFVMEVAALAKILVLLIQLTPLAVEMVLEVALKLVMMAI